MKFFTAYDRPSIEECPLEEHPDEGLVERAGYVDTEQLVQRLLEAGENLQIYREAEYPGDEEVPDDAPGNRMRNRIDALREQKALRKKVEADNGPLGRYSGLRGSNRDGSGQLVVDQPDKRDEREPDARELGQGRYSNAEKSGGPGGSGT